MSTPEDRAAWQALADSATVGPWDQEDHPDGALQVYSDGPGWPTVGVGMTFEDALFIAAAREAVPTLLAEVADLEARLEMALTMHQVQFERGNRRAAEVDRLRAGIVALASTWEGDALAGDRYCARELRDLLEES